MLHIVFLLLTSSYSCSHYTESYQLGLGNVFYVIHIKVLFFVVVS